MGKFKANEEQQLFLDTFGSNLLVSASAGSGKTSTMIEKLVKILCEKRLPVTSLLVVTYTNASGAEIKQKLYNAISSQISETNNKELKEFLKINLENLNNAEIGTLHSICKKLITKYFYEIDLSPDFTLISEKEGKYLLDTAIKNVFDKHLNDNAFYDLYECYNAKRNENTLKEIILSMYYYIIAKVDYSNWKYRTLTNSYNTKINENICCKYVLDYYKEIFKGLLKECDRLILIANTMPFENYLSFLNTRKQFIHEFLSAKDIETAIKILDNITVANKPRVSKNSSAEEIEFDDKIIAFRDDWKSVVEEIEKTFVLIKDNFEENIVRAKKNSETLFSITEEIIEYYASLKKSKNTLDFNDLENLMLKLLENNNIKGMLKEKYSFVFVDEYQDINDKQEEIILNLVSEDNYYMIGDVKQSIYAFRQSSPKIFISKYVNFSNNINGKVIDFNKNYRSDKNILEFNNLVFDTLITNETIGIDYKQNARFVSDKELNGVNVNLKIINTNVDEDEEKSDKDEKEALVISQEISDILKRCKSDGTPFQYKDIAIILRQRGSLLKSIYKIFNKLQIPFSMSIRNEFFDTFEINILISILKVVSNYKDDLAISVVLKNLFDVSEEELLEIRKNSDEKYFYNCVENYNKNDNIKSKIEKLFQFIVNSRRDLSCMTIREYLINVIKENNLILKLKSLPDGNEKESNILEFLNLSSNENYKYNIDKFLEYIDFVGKDTPLKNITTGDNAVQLCTIHYSKGLEYPAVILGGLGSKYSLNKNTNNIIMNGTFGIGVKSINSDTRMLKDTIVRNCCKLDNKKSELNEEIRLLYVAMTRPKEYLSLIGRYDISSLEKNKNKSIYQSNNSLDLIFKSFDNIYNSSFLNSKKFIMNEEKSNAVGIEILSLDEIVLNDENVDSNVVFSVSNTELTNKLIEQYNNKPNIQTFTIKNTVTNILKEEEDYSNTNYIPENFSFNDKKEDIDVLKLGTAYHAIMQYVKFGDTKENIVKLIDELVNKNIISEEISKNINVDEIYSANCIMEKLSKNAKFIYREKQFLLRENYNKLVKNSDNNSKVIVQGIIDLVIDNGEDVILIDYKTNKTKNEQLLIDKYSLQLNIYKLAFEKATNLKITKVYLYSFYNKKLIEIK